MALEAGEMSLTVEFAKDLKDKDWFGKQDPYAVVRAGTQQFRTRTATDGGKNPVWNETFRFNIINENNAELTIKDDDLASHDDYIGTTQVSFAKAREYGRDTIQAPVRSKSGKQHGFVQITLMFVRNASLKAGGHGAYPGQYPPQYPAQYGYPQQIPGYGVPQQAYGAPPGYGAPPQYGAPPPGYGAPAAYPPPGAGYPPPQYGAPPPQYGAPPPQYGAPPPQYGAPPPQYGAPPPQYGAYPGYPPR